MIVDFATFCYSGDVHRLHKPGQLEKQVLSNDYPFRQVIVVYQNLAPPDWLECTYPVLQVTINDIDKVLLAYDIDLDEHQYQSPTDNHHTWKVHVVNHLEAVRHSPSDYIVFADLDCWMISQPDSWVQRGIEALESDPTIFIVSPNDGESERRTQVMSQQMFLVKTEDFRNADFNQPGYSGNPRDYSEMPEYHAMLEGRMHYYCQAMGRYRYVLPSEYRYWHHNRTTADDQLETDLSKWH